MQNISNEMTFDANKKYISLQEKRTSHCSSDTRINIDMNGLEAGIASYCIVSYCVASYLYCLLFSPTLSQCVGTDWLVGEGDSMLGQMVLS